MNIELLNGVPKQPGVYLWKNKLGNVIYVGKAKNLNSRMKQYFKGMQNSYKTQKLVSLIDSFDYIITSSEKEALILERNLIEKHVPEFNILLTDDKRYPYIKISLKDKLEVSLAYRVKDRRDKALYYGPFPTGFGAKKMANLISRLTLYKQGLPIKDATQEEWEEKYNYAKKLLTSGSNELLKELTNKMEQASESMQYEVAQDIKESIQALKFFKDKQVVELSDNRVIDVISFIEKDGYLSISLLFYRYGSLLSKKEVVVEITTSVEESVRQFISQYYGINVEPDLIVSNREFDSEVELLVPQKGKFKNVLDIAIKNASDNIELKLESFIRKEELTIGAISELAKLIKIESAAHILMVDNSTTNNTNPVSVIVSYRNGIKQPSEYRKYKVVVDKRAADVDYMKQGVTKYFENENNIKPDLFIVDGGVAQINEIKPLLPKGIKLIGLVKNDKHVTEAIVDDNGQRIAIENKTLLNFLKGIQVEVDRYAKSYHTRTRKTTLEGKLINVPGVGPKTEEKLLEHFKTYSAIYNASIEDIAKIVPEHVAHLIKKELES